MMGVAEELRTLAGAWDEWGLGGKLTELAERLETQEVADATSVLAVVAEMERHISGVEWMQESPVAKWARKLRESVKGATDVEEDARAAKWVREHGGLEEVARATRDADNRRVELCSLLGVDTTTGWSDAVAELDRRLMPPGMEWPRFEDGEPVKFGDMALIDGDADMVEAVQIWIHGKPVIYGDGGSQQLESGERVKRPEPAPVGADGLPIREGDRGYWIERPGIEVIVKRIDQSECAQLTVYDVHARGNTISASEFTHTKPEPPDSWEQLEEDALLDPCDYFNKKLSRECADCTASCFDSCVAQHSADLVRRAKALAERERGE